MFHCVFLFKQHYNILCAFVEASVKRTVCIYCSTIKRHCVHLLEQITTHCVHLLNHHDNVLCAFVKTLITHFLHVLQNNYNVLCVFVEANNNALCAFVEASLQGIICKF